MLAHAPGVQQALTLNLAEEACRHLLCYSLLPCRSCERRLNVLGACRSCAAAVPAWHLRRPVRLALDRDEDMQTTGHRHAFQATYKACKRASRQMRCPLFVLQFPQTCCLVACLSAVSGLSTGSGFAMQHEGDVRRRAQPGVGRLSAGCCIAVLHAAVQVGFTAAGRVLALQLDMYSNAGNSLDLSTSIMDRALVHCDCACAPPRIPYSSAS